MIFWVLRWAASISTASSCCHRNRRNRTQSRPLPLTASRRVESQGEELSIDVSNRPRRPIFELKRALWVSRLRRRLEKRPQKGKTQLIVAHSTFFQKRWRRTTWASSNGVITRRKTRRTASNWYLERLVKMIFHYFIASTKKLRPAMVAHVRPYLESC